MSEQIEAYLQALARDDCYRVDRVLKSSAAETTELVFFVGANGAERGPFVRKRFAVDSGLGGAYARLWEAQRQGRRFLHVPRVEECYQAGESQVIVVEFVHGETLADAVYRRDPSVQLAAEVFPALCEAVRELHEGFDPPLIHRDLKPSNIVLSERALTLIDLGIARTYSAEADADTHRFGTRSYAPPEQFGFGQTDVRSDVYALGLLLYYCLTERTPDAQARELRWGVAGVPEQLRCVIEKATSFDPAMRYRNVAELQEAFSAAMRRMPPSPPSGYVPVPAPAGECAAAIAPEQGIVAVSANEPRTRAQKRKEARGEDALPLRERAANLLRRVPRPLGFAWDVVLVCFLILYLAACIDSALNPAPENPDAAAPALWRLACYLLMYVTLFVPMAFLVCDRRPLYRAAKRLADVPISKQAGVVLAIMVIGVVVTGLLATLMPGG